MGAACIHEGVRRMRFSTLLDRHERGELTEEEAAAMLGIGVRGFQRRSIRFEAAGEAGLADRGSRRPSPKRAPREELERLPGLCRDKYSGFTVKRFHEKLVAWHDEPSRGCPRLPAPLPTNRKPTDHEPQKHDSFTRYGQERAPWWPVAYSSPAWSAVRAAAARLARVSGANSNTIEWRPAPTSTPRNNRLARSTGRVSPSTFTVQPG